MKFIVLFVAAIASVAIARPAEQSADTSGVADATLDSAALYCYWDGTSPFCAGGCPEGYYEERRNSCGDGACCWTGVKVRCCKNV